MSVEYKTETKTIKSKVIRCDFCNKTMDAYSDCTICGVDVCWRCAHNEYEFGSDYPTRYCQKCWDLGEEYRKKIEEIEFDADEKIEELRRQWEVAAKSARG